MRRRNFKGQYAKKQHIFGNAKELLWNKLPDWMDGTKKKTRLQI